jgi:hypothetical protein
MGICSEWSASRPGCFTTGERALDTHCVGGWVGPRASLDDRKRKFLTLPWLVIKFVNMVVTGTWYGPLSFFRFYDLISGKFHKVIQSRDWGRHGMNLFVFEPHTDQVGIRDIASDLCTRGDPLEPPPRLSWLRFVMISLSRSVRIPIQHC